MVRHVGERRRSWQPVTLSVSDLCRFDRIHVAAQAARAAGATIALPRPSAGGMRGPPQGTYRSMRLWLKGVGGPQGGASGSQSRVPLPVIAPHFRDLFPDLGETCEAKKRPLERRDLWGIHLA
jgi:hypothetical protein